MQLDIFNHDERREVTAGMTHFRGFFQGALMREEVETLLEISPLRSMTVPGGKQMSVATSSAGRFGWISDSSGYAYSETDPLTGLPWPAIPEEWLKKAEHVAQLAGFRDFLPDACLMNCYTFGARMGLHQDRNEADFRQPIVSFSIGADATFYFTAKDARGGPTRNIILSDGDALVFGGPARMLFHGIKPLRSNGGRFRDRINITFSSVAARLREHRC